MLKEPDERIESAKQMYLGGMESIGTARQLDLLEGTVRRWKSTHEWDSERLGKKDANVRKRQGSQPGNKNATKPSGDRHVERHGFFTE